MEFDALSTTGIGAYNMDNNYGKTSHTSSQYRDDAKKRRSDEYNHNDRRQNQECHRRNDSYDSYGPMNDHREDYDYVVDAAGGGGRRSANRLRPGREMDLSRRNYDNLGSLLDRDSANYSGGGDRNEEDSDNGRRDDDRHSRRRRRRKGHDSSRRRKRRGYSSSSRGRSYSRSGKRSYSNSLPRRRRVRGSNRHDRDDRHYDSDDYRSSSRSRAHGRRRRSQSADDRRRNNHRELQNNNEGGDNSLAYVVSEDSDNFLAAMGKADPVDNTGDLALANDRKMKSSKSAKKPSHREDRKRSSGKRRHSSPSSESEYSHTSHKRGGENYHAYNPPPPGLMGNDYAERGDFSFKRRSRSYSSPPSYHRSKRESSRKRKKKSKRKSRRRHRLSSSCSLSRSRSRDDRYHHSSYSLRSLSPTIHSDGKREHYSRSRSFSNSSRKGHKKHDKERRRRRSNGRKRVKKAKHRRRKSSTGGKRSHQSDSSKDDTVGHFHGGPGTMIDHRYQIIRDVGLGTFGRVVECLNLRQPTYHRDNDSHRTVAIKIVRNIQRYHDSAIIEADICERINREQSKQHKDFCAKMLDRFNLSGHYCLVFECLGKSLYDFLKAHDYRPFPMYCVRDFARQLLETLDFLHGFGLIHTDLKPENILLMNNEETTYRSWDGSSQRVPVCTKVKIIDFGGATYNNEKKSSIINTRQYRAPEVILGWGWSYPSDLWSAGSIIAECYVGELLFATHDNAEHLALIERAVGQFRKDLLDKSTNNLARECFDSHGWHKISGVLSSRSIEHVRKMMPVEQIVSEHDRPSGLGRLLRSLLTIDPNRRVTAREALCSPFFTHPR